MSRWDYKGVPFSTLVGMTMVEIKGAEEGNGSIKFKSSDGREFLMYHEQDCCEGVSIDSIDGDINDLLNTPILSATDEENNDNQKEREYYDNSFTWTFYRIQTIKGLVVIKWYGESNGYYSERVDFVELEKENN